MSLMDIHRLYLAGVTIDKTTNTVDFRNYTLSGIDSGVLTEQNLDQAIVNSAVVQGLMAEVAQLQYIAAQWLYGNSTVQADVDALTAAQSRWNTFKVQNDNGNLPNDGTASFLPEQSHST